MYYFHRTHGYVLPTINNQTKLRIYIFIEPLLCSRWGNRLRFRDLPKAHRTWEAKRLAGRTSSCCPGSCCQKINTPVQASLQPPALWRPWVCSSVVERASACRLSSAGSTPGPVSLAVTLRQSSPFSEQVSSFLNQNMGLPRWLSGLRIRLQIRRHGRHRFDPWVGKIPWRRAWKPTPLNILLGESHVHRSLDYSP